MDIFWGSSQNWTIFRGHFYESFRDFSKKKPIPLDGDSATIRNFGQNDTNRSRNDKSAVEAQ